MARRDDENEFRPRVGPPKARGRAQTKFINRVLKATSKAGRTIGKTASTARSRPGAKAGRGQVAAQLAGRANDPRTRRVVIKTRLVNLKEASPRSTAKHLRYIERDGVSPDGGRGELYGADTDEADPKEFTERTREDRHQFRFILSPEDGHDIGDLKAFTRDFLAQMQRDLGTQLEWVAVDHWDTDDPHTHVVLRGKDEHGRDLVIARDYISHGMRARASELATRWLGPRTELEIRESLTKQVSQERWTSLDRQLQQEASEGVVVVRDKATDAKARFRSGLLIGRLDRLTGLGLAEKLAPLKYRLAPNFESVLRALGDRGDIIRTLQRAMGREERQFEVFDHSRATEKIVGRVVGKGLADELSEQGYLIVDGVDGRAHYVKLPEQIDFTEIPTGSVIEVRGGSEVRPSDRTIAKLAQDGIYRTGQHLLSARAQAREGFDPQTYVQAHERRLEALRRAGIVERLEEGIWRVPSDFLERASAYDAGRANGANVEIRSYLPLAQQTRAIGATWLDEQLLAGPQVPATQGFGAEVRTALTERRDFLVSQGFAERRGQQVIYARNLLTLLRAKEIEATASRIESETGLKHRPLMDGRPTHGIYRRSLMLASGRFAVLDDATGFSLVPWRPVLEQRLGKAISATVRGDWVSFDFGRKLGLSL